MQTLQRPRDVIPFQKPQDSIFSILITRKISRVITFYVLRVHPQVTPNQLSVASFVLCGVACWLFLLPDYFLQCVGVLLLQLSFAIDCSDGEVSRITNQTSKFGAWFDSVLDRFKEVLMFSVLTYYAYMYLWYNASIIFIGAGATIGMMMVAYIREAKKSAWGALRSSEFFITKNIYIGTVDVTVYAVSFAVLARAHVVVLLLFLAVSIPLVIKQILSAYKLK